MVLEGTKQLLNFDFSWGAADLKKYVSIYTRKQVGQKREGISASQF